MAVSQGLGTTEFTNLIGWNRYWKRSRFSHLDRHLDRLHFAEKKLQLKMQNYWQFSSNNIYSWSAKKPDEKKANFGRIKSSSSLFASKMSVSTFKELNCSCLPYNKYLINRAKSVCMGESWPPSFVQTSLRSVCTHDLGQDSPIQTSCPVNKS